MRKLFALMLAAILAGCGSGTLTLPSINTDSTAPESSKPSDKPEKPEVKTEFDTGGTIEEQTLYEEDGIVIVADSLTYESYRAKLLIRVENGSDRDIQVLSGTMGLSCNGINDWMVHDGWVNVEVPAGKKANESAYFDYAPLMACGINGIETLYMTFEIEFDGKYSDRILVEPVAIETALAENTDEELSLAEAAGRVVNLYQNNHELQYSEDSVLYEEAGIKVTGAAYFTSPDGGKILMLGVVNESEEIRNLYAEKISADGFSLCPAVWTSETILPGKQTMLRLELNNMADEEDWKAMGITDLSDITLNLGVETIENEELGDSRTITIHVSDKGGVTEQEGDELYSNHEIRILSKGISKDSLYVKWRLLVENNNDFKITVSDGWGDQLSIDDYMIDYIMFAEYIDAHQSSIAEIEIPLDTLEDAGLDPDHLGRAELNLEIQDESYHDIDAITLVCTFTEE